MCVSQCLSVSLLSNITMWTGQVRIREHKVVGQ